MNQYQQFGERCPFCGILAGEEPGKIIARDDAKGFALIQSIHPEGAIHWMALPFEHVSSTEELEKADRNRFLELVDFAVQRAQEAALEEPLLQSGFSIKVHFGSFETVPHAKLHVLSTE